MNSTLLTKAPQNGIAYRVDRSANRKSLCIQVASAQVVVKAPTFIGLSEIDSFVQKKADWIRRKQKQQQAILDSLPEWRFESGAVFPYLGKQLTLVVNKLDNICADFVRHESVGDQLVLQCYLGRGRRIADERRVRSLLVGWYERQAEGLLREKTAVYAQKLGVRVGHITLKVTKSKWGHCTPAGDIQYNWQIVLAPEAVVDYLVAHEVSHRLELNHSDRFWRWVATLCPDYKRQRSWLKQHGQKLAI